MTAYLNAKDVWKTYGEQIALRGASVELNQGEILNVLHEFNNVVDENCRRGNSVSLAKLGIVRPTLRLDGRFRITMLVDAGLRKAINVAGAFLGAGGWPGASTLTLLLITGGLAAAGASASVGGV